MAYIHETRSYNRLNTLCFRFLRKIFEITWKDKITNQEVLETAELPTIQYFLSERRLRRWLGHGPRAPSKRPTLWTAGSRQTIDRAAASSLQRRLQTRHEGSQISVGDRIKSRVAVKTGCKPAEVERTRICVEKRQRKKSSTRRTR